MRDENSLDIPAAVADILAHPNDVQRGYLARELVMATFPHKDPGPEVEHWKRTNGNLTLLVSSGVNLDLQPYGIPYGSIVRLVLFYIVSEAVKTGDRTIKFGSTLSAFLRSVGLSPETGRGKRGDAKRLHAQLERLFHCRISFVYAEGGHEARLNMQIASKTETWWDYKHPEQGTIFDSYIVLGQEFFDAITAAPVPIDFRALKALKRSPFALDLYAWGTWRVWVLQRTGKAEVEIPIELLRDQFGAEYGRDRDFKAALADALADVKAVFLAFDYELRTKHLVIRAGKVPIPAETPEKEFRRITKRAPDKLAPHSSIWFRDTYPKHDYKAAQTAFHAWIERSQIEPKNIDALFRDFAPKWVAGKE